MPKGSCDPSPDPFNVTTMTKGNGDVTIDVRWTWDGTSVYPDCDGPLVRVRVENKGQTSWWVHVRRRRGGTRAIEITPGAARNVGAAALSSVGIDTLSDLDNLQLTPSPDTPPALQA